MEIKGVKNTMWTEDIVSNEQIKDWLLNRFGPDYKFNVQFAYDLRNFCLQKVKEILLNTNDTVKLSKIFGL